MGTCCGLRIGGTGGAQTYLLCIDVIRRYSRHSALLAMQNL